MWNGAAPIENGMEFPQKIKNNTAILPHNLPSGVYPKELKSESDVYPKELKSESEIPALPCSLQHYLQ